MTSASSGTQTLPDTISASMANTAFDHIFFSSDWRLQVASLHPITLAVEHDAAFGACLAGSRAWQPSDQAKGWVANRVLEMAAAYDKTSVRRLSLQIPRAGDDLATEAFLIGLQGRIKDDVRAEISRHFDQSIPQWEDDAMAFAMGPEDPHDRAHLFLYAGLDQRVSIEAGRKALKWVMGRTHWWLEGAGAELALIPDYRFDNVKSERGSMDEMVRARSLVARCVEVIVNEGVRRAMADKVCAPVTKASIKADLNRLFEKDGVWGLIHLILVEDRRRYHITAPAWQNAKATALLERQDPYLFEPTRA